jgi:hypothetical protein
MPRCSRCGAESVETHELRAVTFDHELSRLRYADGAMIDGQKIDLCDDCRGEFEAFLQTPGGLYTAQAKGKKQHTPAR